MFMNRCLLPAAWSHLYLRCLGGYRSVFEFFMVGLKADRDGRSRSIGREY